MSEGMRRVEFDKFCTMWRYDLSTDEDGFYTSAITQRVFDAFCWAWISSRQSLVVKLPEWDNYDTTKQVLSAVAEELDAAGVRYE